MTVNIGTAGKRSIIAMWFTPEEAEDAAHAFGYQDSAFNELMEAANTARIQLGEEPQDAVDPVARDILGA